MTDLAAAKKHRLAPLTTPTPLGADATRDISAELNALLADTFALYFKTKNFHWHMSGPSFRDYHLLLDEQSDQIFATVDPIAERVRKLGGTTLRSSGHAVRERQRRRLRDAGRHAGRAEPGQPARRRLHARDARPVRPLWRRGDRQPAGGVDRRGRTPHLVPLRGGSSELNVPSRSFHQVMRPNQRIDSAAAAIATKAEASANTALTSVSRVSTCTREPRFS